MTADVIKQDNVGGIKGNLNTLNDRDTMVKIVFDSILNVTFALGKTIKTHRPVNTGRRCPVATPAHDEDVAIEAIGGTVTRNKVMRYDGSRDRSLTAFVAADARRFRARRLDATHIWDRIDAWARTGGDNEHQWKKAIPIQARQQTKGSWCHGRA